MGPARERPARVPQPAQPLTGHAAVARVQSMVADLMLASRVSEPLAAAGYEVVTGPAPDPTADLIVADLDAVDIDAVAAAGPPTLGFYSHVDVETRARALEAGFDKVVPRSRMARELPDLVAALLAGSG